MLEGEFAARVKALSDRQLEAFVRLLLQAGLLPVSEDQKALDASRPERGETRR